MLLVIIILLNILFILSLYYYFYNFYKKISIENIYKYANKTNCKPEAYNYASLISKDSRLIKTVSILNDKIINIYENNNYISYLFKDFGSEKTLEFLYSLTKKTSKFQDCIECNKDILELYFDIKSNLFVDFKFKDINIYCHGVGGMIGLLFYLDIERSYNNKIDIYLFGVPRFCDNKINEVIQNRDLEIKNFLFFNDPILDVLDSDVYKHIQKNISSDYKDNCNVHNIQNYTSFYSKYL